MTKRQKEYIEFIEEFTYGKFTGNPNSNSDISAFIHRFGELAKLNAMDPWQLQY